SSSGITRIRQSDACPYRHSVADRSESLAMGTVGGRSGAPVPWSGSAEDELRVLRAVLEGAPVPVIAVDSGGRVCFASPAWAELCGAPPEDMTTLRAWADRVFRERADEALAALAPGEEVELRIATVRGEPRTFAFKAAVVDDRAAGALT